MVTAQPGAEALTCLASAEFALVVLDVRMPDMDGFETASHIRRRARTRDIPVVFLTAGAVDEDVWHGYASGAIDYIIKPVSPDVLRAKVSRLLDLAPRSATGPAEDDGPVNILVVDDEPANRTTVAAALAGLGGRVVLAASADAALRALLDQDFAVALIDVTMPERDGFELVAEIRQRPRTRELPVIFVSAVHRAAEEISRGCQCAPGAGASGTTPTTGSRSKRTSPSTPSSG